MKNKLRCVDCQKFDQCFSEEFISKEASTRPFEKEECKGFRRLNKQHLENLVKYYRDTYNPGELMFDSLHFACGETQARLEGFLQAFMQLDLLEESTWISKQKQQIK